MTFHLGKRQSSRGKYLRSSDATEGAHLLGTWLMVGRDTFSAAPKEVACSPRHLCPGSWDGHTEVALCGDVTEECSNL